MKNKWTLMLGALCLVSASVLSQETGVPINAPKSTMSGAEIFSFSKWTFPYERNLYDTRECD